MATVNTEAELVAAVANQTYIELGEGSIVLTAALSIPAFLRVIKGKGSYVSSIEGAHATADLIAVVADGTLVLEDCALRTDGTGDVIDGAADSTVILRGVRALGRVEVEGTLDADGTTEITTLAYAGSGAATGTQAVLLNLGAPAAADVDIVHAAVEEGAANAFPGPITNPVVPRNITATFAAGWQGGDITVVGTDQFDQALTEVIADTAGSTVAGVKIFKTVTSISKETLAGTTDTVTIGIGDKLGITAKLADTAGLLFVDNVAEAGTFDKTYNGVLPTTVADAANVYKVLVNVVA